MLSQLSPRARAANHRRRTVVNSVMTCVTGIAAVAAAAMLLIVLGYLIIQGFHALKPAIVVKGPTPMGIPGGGLRNGIIGSLELLGIASLFGIPIGVLGGVYQVESRGLFGTIVRFFTDVLNSIPSIVIGVFVYMIVVLPAEKLHPGYGFSALAGGLALGVIMIPTVMRTTEEILRLVPVSLREASLAVGATRWKTMVQVVLPAARGGIVTGIMLALARIAGETAPLLFTAFGNLNFNINFLKPIDALPLDIYEDSISPYPYLHVQALAGAVLLIGLIFLMSLLTRYALRGSVLEGR